MCIIIVNYRLKIETLIANAIITYSYVQQYNIKTYYKVGVYDGKKNTKLVIIISRYYII